jgi:hypothetical protein
LVSEELIGKLLNVRKRNQHRIPSNVLNDFVRLTIFAEKVAADSLNNKLCIRVLNRFPLNEEKENVEFGQELNQIATKSQH